jgi:hypothetical protein
MAQSLGGGVLPSEQSDERFGRLAFDLFALQFEWNVPYRKLCEARGVSPANVSQWTGIPAVPASAFKELELTSLPASERTKVFHSSGTTGQRASRHFHDHASLALYEASLIPWFQRHLLPERDRAGEGAVVDANGRIDFLVLTPPVIEAPHSSLIHMFDTVVAEFGSGWSRWCGKAGTDGSWSVDQDAAEKILDEASSSGRPVAVMGTAFSFVHLLDELAGRNRRLNLPPCSRVLETGGYKGRSRVMAKSELHGLIAERLGISASHIVCEYGMSELSSQSYDSSFEPSRNTQHATRCFRFPPWARVQIISPETGSEVSEGETGLLRIFDLANVRSVLAIQTEDLAIRRGDGFELIGRAAAAEPRGCSLMTV